MKYVAFFDNPIYLCKSICQLYVELIALDDYFIHFCSVYQDDVRFAC